jgi:hypothetical protein
MMFVSKFLITAAPCEAIPFNRRSMLFAARAAMRCNAVSEPPSISPITAALVSVVNHRKLCPEVPSVSAPVTADVESGMEAQDTPVPNVKKSGRKRKNEVPGTPRRKRLPGSLETDDAGPGNTLSAT